MKLEIQIGVIAATDAVRVAKWEWGPGREIAMGALFHDTVQHVTAWSAGEMVGVASYRIVDDFIKRINTGVRHPRSGIASALIREMIARNPGKPMYTKSIPDAWGFCEAIGMKHVMDFDDARNRRLYLWSAKECAAFLNKGAP